MRSLIDQIESSLESDLYYLTLFAALTIPDIGGALDSDNGEATGPKYIEWYEEWVRPRFVEAVLSTMSGTLDAIRKLAAEGDLRISDHGYDEIAEDRIPVRDIISGVDGAAVVEDYPDFGKGPAVLVLQYDQNGDPVHVV